MIADLCWWLLYAIGAAAVPVVLHEMYTGLRRFILIRRRAQNLRAIRGARTEVMS